MGLTRKNGGNLRPPNRDVWVGKAAFASDISGREDGCWSLMLLETSPSYMNSQRGANPALGGDERKRPFCISGGGNLRGGGTRVKVLLGKKFEIAVVNVRRHLKVKEKGIAPPSRKWEPRV